MALHPTIRKAVFIRDNWKCRACKGVPIHPHHVRFRSHGGQDVVCNLLTLCNQCHAAVHAGLLWLYVASTGERLTGSNTVDATQKLRFVRKSGWKPQ